MTNSSIPVLVNDVPITEYDIGQRQRLDRLGGGGKQISRAAVIEELIDETLESIEAQRQAVSVPDQQVDGAFANIAQHVKMSPAGLTKALASQGIDSTSLKKRLRAQMIWQTLVQRRVAAKATVTNEAVKDAIKSKESQAAETVTEFMLQQIIFVVPKGAPAALLAQRRAEAQAFRQRFSGCENSLTQAKALRGVVVKELGRRMSNELSGPSSDALQKAKAGDTLPPQQIDDGIAVVAVCSSQSVQSNAAARSQAQNSLYIQQATDLGKDYLKELRDRAIIERR